MTYTYPDTDNEKIVNAIIEQNSPFDGYWERSSERVLSVFLDHVNNYISSHKGKTLFLDIGTGIGRLLPEYAPSFDRVIAIEPDVGRLQAAKKFIESTNFSKKVRFESKSLEEITLKIGSIDVALASHVIQHIKSNNVPSFFQKTHQNLKTGGLLLIEASHSTREQDYFTTRYIKNGNLEVKKISEREFNTKYLDKKGTLPTHYFTFTNLEKNIYSSGFSIIERGSSHELSKIPILDKVIDRDLLINMLPLFQERFGSNLYFVCKKV